MRVTGRDWRAPWKKEGSQHMRLVRWQGDGLGVAIRSECESGETVLVPTHVAKRMVDSSIRSAGENPDDYGVHILASWVIGKWRSYGDGTELIDPNDRMPYLWRAFDIANDAGRLSVLRRSKGALTLAETIGSRAVAWLPEEGTDADLALPLTVGERELVGVAREYARLIREDGLVDVGTVYKELPQLLAERAPSSGGHVLAGFSQMGYVQQTLVAGMDRELGNMTLLMRAMECDLMDARRVLGDDGTWEVEHLARPGSHGFHFTSRAQHVLDDLKRLGTQIEVIPGCHGTPVSSEGSPVSDLARALFVQDASDGIPCRSLIPPRDGSISLLHVAGVTAEDAAIANMTLKKAESGDVAIIGRDAWHMWEALAPRLLARHEDESGREMPPVAVKATVSVPLSSIRTVSVMLDAARQIIVLSGMLSESERDDLGLGPAKSPRHRWSPDMAMRHHGQEPTTAGWFMDMSRDVLGDMSWWPPDEILDLLSEESSGVSVSTSMRLRSRWFRKRTLSAYDVLSVLLDEEQVGSHMAKFAKTVADGHMSELLSLMRIRVRRMGIGSPDRGGASVMAGATRALTASAMDILVSATKPIADPVPGDSESIERYFTCVSQLLTRSRVSGELSALPDDAIETDEGLPAVALLSMDDANGIPPQSYETVIMTEQDSSSSAIARDDSLQNVLMAKLGCAETAQNMSNYRDAFMTAVALARESVVFERVLRKADGRHVSDTFPSAGLINVTLAYKEGTEGEIPVCDASEMPFVRNFQHGGQVPRKIGEMDVSPIEECPAGMTDLMWASRPRGGEEGHQVMLTASDVDTYAHCGYKWFVERVLGIRSPIDSLPPYAFGSFAHTVLEEAHRNMIRNAARAVIDDGGRVYPVTPYVRAMAAGDHLDKKVSEPGEGGVPDGYGKGMPGTRIGGIGQVSVEAATEMFRDEIRETYVRELSGAGKPGTVPLIPHTITEATKMDMMAQSIVRFPAYESRMFWREREGRDPSYFVPRLTELAFGEEYGRSVTIAGVPFHGVIDRIDINSAGECIIIDYKHASPDGFARKHCLDPYGDSNLQLIVYAMAVRQILPDLRIAGLVYVGNRYPYAISGKLDDGVFDATDAKGTNLSADSRLTPKDGKAKGKLPADAPTTMEAFIDMMSRQVEEHVENMVRGIHSSPEPEGRGIPARCSFCDAKGLCMHS